MAEKYLTEAFQELEILNEETFNISDDGVAYANDFIENDETTDMEIVIDPLAETEEELQDSYVGKVILDCTICQSKIYKNPEEVTINEEESLANIGEVCPYCQSSDGYKVIGQVAPYVEGGEEEVDVETDDENAEVDVEELPAEEAPVVETEEEEDLDEAIKTKKGVKKHVSMKEDLNNVQIETDTERITVTSEPKEEPVDIISTEGEMIAPVEPDVEAQFNTEEPETVEEPIADEPMFNEEPEYQDIDIDEFAEDEFDGLGENYLRRVYDNVKSYKTIGGSVNGNTLKLEGLITFKSGKTAKTNFVFESKSVNKNGKVKFVGLNEQFAKGKKTYTLTGSVTDKKFLAESLTYNYRGRDAKTGESKRLYGRIINK